MSPTLFELVVAALGAALENAGIGIEIDGVKIPGLFFADDMCLTVPLDQLDEAMRIVATFAEQDQLEFNAKKSCILPIGFTPSEEGYHLMDIPDEKGPESVIIPYATQGKYLGVTFNAKYSIYAEQWKQSLQRLQTTTTLLGLAIRETVNPVFLGKLVWNTYAIPSFAYAWELLPISDPQMEKINLNHRQFKRMALGLGQYTSKAVLDKVDMGCPISIHLPRAKLTYYWRIKNLPENRWVKKAFNEQMRWLQWEKKPTNFWMQDIQKILQDIGLPWDASWTKAQNTHYWNTKIERYFINKIDMKEYNRFEHQNWMKAMVGQLRWFPAAAYEGCPACGNAPFSWDHVILHCTDVHFETCTIESLERLQHVTSEERKQIDKIIRIRWNMAKKKFKL